MKKFQALSNAEMEIMQAIWELDTPVTSTQLRTVFESKGWKKQTMSTFLARLVDKGFLLANKLSKSNTYTPTVTEQGYRKMEAESVIDSMYDGSVLSFLATLYGDEGGNGKGACRTKAVV